MKIIGIYQIQSRINPDKVYIGSSINIGDRWRRHLRNLKLNKHDNDRLQNHCNKYGIQDLSFTILIECEKRDLIVTEQKFIDNCNPFFNICRIAGITLGYKHSPEIIAKMRMKQKGHYVSDETRKKIGEANKVRVISEDTRMKFKKRIPYNKGVKMSEEQKQKRRHPHKKRA